MAGDGMQIANVADVPVTVREHVRTGRLEYQTLLTGKPGSSQNFALMLTPLGSDYSTPRHRHNFEQIRYQIEGKFTYGRSGDLNEGMVGYFPEGTPYGPTNSDGATVVLVLQFGGPSGNGYLSEQEQEPILAKLKERGEFNGGVFTFKDQEGKKHNQDGYEALWEAAMGRDLRYPPPRYHDPVFMRPDNFHWRSADKRDVEYKLLGSFSERHTQIGFLRIKANSAAPLSDNSIYFVIEGCGRGSARTWTKHSAIYLTSGETGSIEALEDSELMHVGLPDLRDLLT
jgi:mannose-6-phosphate isomerase-like protein (cupin superfamily)